MSDFCYSWPLFNRVFRQAARMDRMLDRVGVSPSVAVRLESGIAWYEARTRCIECVHEQCCRNWLESTSPSSAEPDFCPNAQFFEECKETQSKPSRELDLRALHASPDGSESKVDEPTVSEGVQRTSRT
jgi:Family of unknown function (DUF6455)